jgi:hypothetical protein
LLRHENALPVMRLCESGRTNREILGTIGAIVRG